MDLSTAVVVRSGKYRRALEINKLSIFKGVSHCDMNVTCQHITHF